jgi:hypothetical protein
MSQDFVTRSDNINDVIYYLRVECEFEVLKLTSFVTTNLVNFERRTGVFSGSHEAPREGSIAEMFIVDNPD